MTISLFRRAAQEKGSTLHNAILNLDEDYIASYARFFFLFFGRKVESQQYFLFLFISESNNTPFLFFFHRVGHDMNPTLLNDCTPLHLAASLNLLSSIKLLLNYGADPARFVLLFYGK